MKKKLFIGFAESVETAPSVYTEEVVERKITCDVTEDAAKFNASNQSNTDVDLGLKFEIFGDANSRTDYFKIRYVVYRGVKWRVESAAPVYRHIVLRVRGIYNGNTPQT